LSEVDRLNIFLTGGQQVQQLKAIEGWVLLGVLLSHGTARFCAFVVFWMQQHSNQDVCTLYLLRCVSATCQLHPKPDTSDEALQQLPAV
jgi:hypothetical protein